MIIYIIVSRLIVIWSHSSSVYITPGKLHEEYMGFMYYFLQVHGDLQNQIRDKVNDICAAHSSIDSDSNIHTHPHANSSRVPQHCGSQHTHLHVNNSQSQQHRHSVCLCFHDTLPKMFSLFRL